MQFRQGLRLAFDMLENLKGNRIIDACAGEGEPKPVIVKSLEMSCQTTSHCLAMEFAQVSLADIGPENGVKMLGKEKSLCSAATAKIQ